MTRLFGKGTGWICEEMPIHKRKEDMIRIYYGSLLDNDDNKNVEVDFSQIKSIKPSFSGNYRLVITYKDNRIDLPTTAKYIEFI